MIKQMTFKTDSGRTVVVIDLDSETGKGSVKVSRDGRAMHSVGIHKEDFDDGVPKK